MAEKYALYQRKGKWDDEVVENWRKVAKKWWDSLYAKADQNQVCMMSRPNH
jgi:predicted transcriptional regulator YdeE